MNRLGSVSRILLETLEPRLLLDGGLGSEIAQFASEQDLVAALLDRAVIQHEWMFNTEVNPWRCTEVDFCAPEYVLVDFDAPDASVGSEAEPARDTDSFSDTNVQVQGVDEGDIVETDGEFVYILSDRLVSIVDVRDPAHPRVASRVPLDPNASGREMYLHQDRLMVLSSSWYYDSEPIPLADGGPVDEFVDAFSDSIRWAPSRSTVIATVIDLSDREDTSIVSRTEIDGSLANSRAIDGTGYLIVDDYLSFPMPETKEITVTNPGEEAETKLVYESEEEYRARIGGSVIDVLPSASTYDAQNSLVATQRVAEYDSTYRTTDPNYQSLESVVTIDMHTELPSIDDGTTVMTNAAHEIFMSTDSLYLFQTKWEANEMTSIMQFDVDTQENSVTPVASGLVNGRILDQFSADERDGQLRIATTTGFGRESSSGVYVLDNVDDELQVIGYVDELAPGEQIFSARFVGTMAYVVTFRQVDPLLAISLADPQNPTVEGELKIPGFSEYIQPIDDDHLLAIGRDADPVTGRAEALQISLFDVANATEPQLVDRYTFVGDFVHSPAEHDHHAFGYYPEFKTLAVPVSSQDGGAWIREEDGEPFWIPAEHNQNLQVFKVDVDSGFEFAGAIEHPSQVRRSLRINDGLFSVSFDTLKVNSITEPTQAVGQLYFLPPQNGGVVPDTPTAEHIDRLFEQAATNQNDPKFDVDGNKLVDNDDVTFMVEAVFKTRAGDTDLDQDVDFADFLALSANFGKTGGWAEGNFDGDGMITIDDFLVLSRNFGLEPLSPESRFRG